MWYWIYQHAEYKHLGSDRHLSEFKGRQRTLKSSLWKAVQMKSKIVETLESQRMSKISKCCQMKLQTVRGVTPRELRWTATSETIGMEPTKSLRMFISIPCAQNAGWGDTGFTICPLGYQSSFVLTLGGLRVTLCHANTRLHNFFFFFFKYSFTEFYKRLWLGLLRNAKTFDTLGKGLLHFQCYTGWSSY